MENQIKLIRKSDTPKIDTSNIESDFEKVSNIEGKPIGDKFDLIKLSAPPHYTAFPSPYISNFLDLFGKKYDPQNDKYIMEPYVGDVSEGKGDVIYMGHTYHTKVPHKAIIPFIEHYTSKGEIVFDGFCGTGMTGVASSFIGRYCILSDLSPIATFIASNNTEKINDISTIRLVFERILKSAIDEYNWMYKTKYEGKNGSINYVIWSDVFACPHCKKEYLFCDLAIQNGQVSTSYKCPDCSSTITKNHSERVYTFEGFLKQSPYLLNITVNGKRFFKKPDEFDLELLKKIDTFESPYWYPVDEVPEGDNFSQPKKSHNFTKVNHFFVKRALFIIAKIYDEIQKIEDVHIKSKILFIFTSYLSSHSTKMTNVQLRNGDYVLTNKSSGNLSVPSMSVEKNIFELMLRKSKDIFKVFEEINSNLKNAQVVVSTQSSTDLQNIYSNYIDYIFVDPPFGANLMYSELNFIWECWLKTKTNPNHEAIMNKQQKKDLDEYKQLMILSFNEFYRILKPNRWITVEFHNSKAAVWKAIQEGLTKAGFIVAQVATIDKQQGSFKQNTTINSVKNDLVINAYKPSESFRNTFLKKAGMNMETEFIKMHLDKLPIEPNVERTQQMLYSKMLAQYIQNGFEVRMDASEFYGMLKSHFIERDGFWFNQEQIPEYEKRTALTENVEDYKKEAKSSKVFRKDLGISQILFITDEKTAIIWLANFLRTPRDYSEIYTEYSKKLMTSEDKIPELKTMLDENFVTENGLYRLPSTNEKKEKEDTRSKRLMKEFNEMLQQAKSGKKVTEVRKEALLHGLMELYKNKDVDNIKLLGKKIDQKIIESDDDVYTIIDWALTKED